MEWVYSFVLYRLYKVDFVAKENQQIRQDETKEFNKVPL